MGMILKIVEDVKNECERKQVYLTKEQEDILAYYLDFHLNDIF